MFTMINKEKFSERLKTVMDYYQLSASAFAEKIEVQKSSISHLLSGRNNPSLEFILKVIRTFDEVELYWLLNGRGSFPKSSESSKATLNVDDHKNVITKAKADDGAAMGKIERIVIFYKDGNFKEYLP